MTRFFIVQWFFVLDSDDVDNDTIGAEGVSIVPTRRKKEVRFVVKANP
jgi:hypothetical protein